MLKQSIKVSWPGCGISENFCRVVLSNELNTNQQCIALAQRANNQLDCISIKTASRHRQVLVP